MASTGICRSLASRSSSGVNVYAEDDLVRIELAQTWARRGIAWFGDPSGQQITQAEDTQCERQAQAASDPGEVELRHEPACRAAIGHRALLTNCEVNISLCKHLDMSMKNYRTRADAEPDPPAAAGQSYLGQPRVYDVWSITP